MSRKALLLPILFLFTITSSNMVNLVNGQADSLDFKFEALAAGRCLIAYGGIGPGVPYPMKWSGLGNGHATVNGHAMDATAFPSSVTGLYISENIRARGAVTVRWTEADGSEHHLAVVMYSTVDSEGLFLPSKNQFQLSIPEYSPPDKFIMFEGVYVNGSKSANISGIAFFSAGIVGPALDSIAVWLVDIGSETLFFIGWSCAGTPTPFPPGYVPAAEAYRSVVREQ
jgi:hypothetical protein